MPTKRPRLSKGINRRLPTVTRGYICCLRRERMLEVEAPNIVHCLVYPTLSIIYIRSFVYLSHCSDPNLTIFTYCSGQPLQSCCPFPCAAVASALPSNPSMVLRRCSIRSHNRQLSSRLCCATNSRPYVEIHP